jgi:hypothetical protein
LKNHGFDLDKVRQEVRAADKKSFCQINCMRPPRCSSSCSLVPLINDEVHPDSLGTSLIRKFSHTSENTPKRP